MTSVGTAGREILALTGFTVAVFEQDWGWESG